MVGLLSELNDLNHKFAYAEKEYKILLAKRVLDLRADGMAVGLIEKVCYGLEDVAEKRFKRDLLEGMVRSTYEAINVAKLQLRLIEAEISREWNNETQINTM